MTRVFAFRCDGPECPEFAIPDLGVGDVRPGRGRAATGTHYCLEHFPYSLCSGCDHPMRPHGGRAKDWPGTKAKGGGGLCSTCYLRVRTHGKVRART